MQAKSGAREVAAALREARSRAIMLNRDVLFSIDVSGHSFSVSGDQRTHTLPRNVNLSLYTAQQELLRAVARQHQVLSGRKLNRGKRRAFERQSSYTVMVNWVTGTRHRTE